MLRVRLVDLEPSLATPPSPSLRGGFHLLDVLLALCIGRKVGLGGGLIVAECAGHTDFIFNLLPYAVRDFRNTDVFKAMQAVWVEEPRFTGFLGLLLVFFAIYITSGVGLILRMGAIIPLNIL